MPEESTTPHLVELTRGLLEAANRQDIHAVMSLYAPAAVFDLSDAALGVFEGAPAIGAFLHGWWGTWENFALRGEEIADLGHGVVLSTIHEEGGVAGGDGRVEQRRGWVILWTQGVITRATAYLDIDEARAVAEQLAESRG
ncbi:MAG TPA: nuclear transport factor 2 family protein [Solirubrobacteraceae bacterium]|jgi:ketosteroid isomerase-like protein|nr:nuclear transport factor 2 family protein [Solirubrobacteraceae bacterium]